MTKCFGANLNTPPNHKRRNVERKDKPSKLVSYVWTSEKIHINYYYYYHLFRLSVYIKRKEHIIYNIYHTVISLYTHFQANHKSGGC